MPASIRPRTNRPNSAPAYYLGRPASWWLSVTGRRVFPSRSGQAISTAITAEAR